MRRRGKPDPLDRVERLDGTVLARLGVPRSRLDETVVSDAVHWAATLTRVGRHPEAAALLDTAAAVDGARVTNRARSARSRAAAQARRATRPASAKPRASWPRTLAVDDALRPPGELLRYRWGRRGRGALAPPRLPRPRARRLARGRAHAERGMACSRSEMGARGDPARSASPPYCSTWPAAARTSASPLRTACSSCRRPRPRASPPQPPRRLLRPARAAGARCPPPTVVTMHDEWLYTGHCAYTLDSERWLTGAARAPISTATPPSAPTGPRATGGGRRSCTSARACTSSALLLAARPRAAVDACPGDCVCPCDPERRRPRALLPPESARGASGPRRPSSSSLHRARGRTRTRTSPRCAPRWSCSSIPLSQLRSGKRGRTSSIRRGEAVLGAVCRARARRGAFLRAADLYIHATRADNHPLAVLEALACGTPVIAARSWAAFPSRFARRRECSWSHGTPPRSAAVITELLADDGATREHGASRQQPRMPGRASPRSSGRGVPRPLLRAVLTLFSVPKPFEGEIGELQRRSVASWRELGVQVVLLGDVEAAARELGVEHVSGLEFDGGWSPAARLCVRARRRRGPLSAALLRQCGRRLRPGPDDRRQGCTRASSGFSSSGRRRRQGSGAVRPRWTGSSSPRGCSATPPFAIGRACFDNWLVWKARQVGVVIDATHDVRAIHQPHGYKHVEGGMDKAYYGEEAARNLELAGGKSRLYTLHDASHVLRDGKLRRNPGAPLRWRETVRKLAWKLGKR